MDTPISDSVQLNRKRKRIFIIGMILLLISFLLLALRAYIKPTISSSAFTATTAQIGNIDNTLDAMGEVLPEFEEVLTSPINAALREVHKNAGTRIKAGVSILSLDKAAAQTEYDKLSFQIESKNDEIRKLKLNLGKSFYDISNSNTIKELRISNLKDAVSSAQRLYKAGGATREDIEGAELNLKVAVLEKQQLENEIRNKQQTMKIEIREAEIALAIQINDQQALRRRLDLADVRATRAGVITWVNRNIGASIREGDPLVRIANLSSFKVAGTIADAQADRLRLNMPVIIRVNGTQLRGIVSDISPAVSNSIISFEVKLEDKDNSLLRPNMKVELYLVTETRVKVLRVANGAAFKGAGQSYIFVIKDGKAIKKDAEIGFSNFDYVEIKRGIGPGDQVINSDMGKYEHVMEVDIKD